MENELSSFNETTLKCPESYKGLSSFSEFLSQSKRKYAYLDSEEFAHVFDPEIEEKLLTSDGVKSLLEKIGIDTSKLEVEVKNRTYDEVMDESGDTCTTNDSEIVIIKNSAVLFRVTLVLKVKHF